MSTSPLADRIAEKHYKLTGYPVVDLATQDQREKKRFELATLIDAQLAEVREGYADLVRSVEVQGKLVGYQSDVLDRARPGLTLITPKGTP